METCFFRASIGHVAGVCLGPLLPLIYLPKVYWSNPGRESIGLRRLILENLTVIVLEREVGTGFSSLGLHCLGTPDHRLLRIRSRLDHFGGGKGFLKSCKFNDEASS